MTNHCEHNQSFQFTCLMHDENDLFNKSKQQLITRCNLQVNLVSRLVIIVNMQRGSELIVVNYTSDNRVKSSNKSLNIVMQKNVCY